MKAGLLSLIAARRWSWMICGPVNSPSIADVRWTKKRFVDLNQRPLGAALLEALHRAHREAGVDGHAGVVDSTQPYTEALERKLGALGFRSAAAWGLVVPEGAPPFVGQPFAEVPNPFAPLLAIWGTGFAVESIDKSGVVMVEFSNEAWSTFPGRPPPPTPQKALWRK